jgi:hypothetical protein
MTDPVRRSQALAAELAAARPPEEEFDEGVVHTVPGVNDPRDLMVDVDEPEGDVYATFDDLVVVKISHELPQMNGTHSWYTAGMTSRLDPSETPAEGLARVSDAVNNHIIETINTDWPVVAELHDQVRTEITQRETSRRIRPQN